MPQDMGAGQAACSVHLRSVAELRAAAVAGGSASGAGDLWEGLRVTDHTGTSPDTSETLRRPVIFVACREWARYPGAMKPKLTSHAVLEAVEARARELGAGTAGLSSDEMSPERWRQHADVVALVRDQAADALPDPSALVPWLRSGSATMPLPGGAGMVVSISLLLVAASVEFYVRGVEHGRKAPRA